MEGRVTGKQRFSMDDVEAGLAHLPSGKYWLVVPPGLEKGAKIIAGETNYPIGNTYGQGAVSYPNKLFQLSVRVEEEMPPDTWYLTPEGAIE